MKAVVWEGEGAGRQDHDEDIPADLQDKAAEYRNKLIEAAVEIDDDAMEAYLEGQEPDEDDAEAPHPQGRHARLLSPCCAARPSRTRACRRCSTPSSTTCRRPSIAKAIKGIDVKTEEETGPQAVDTEPFSMLGFKIMDDPFVGTITFCRVYSGKVESRHGARSTRRATRKSASAACCSCTRTTARTSRKPSRATSSRSPASRTPARATRCAIRRSRCILEKMEFPEPGHRDRGRAEVEGRPGEAGVALMKLAAEDPSFRVSTDQESGQTIIKGMGELHLDIKVDILRRTYKVDVNVGAPQVAYRETLARATEIDYTHKKQTGGTGQFARVKLAVEPNEPGKGNEFESKIVGGTVPKEYIPGVEKGLESVWDNGCSSGFPMVDVKVTLYRRRLPRGRLVGDRLRNRGALRDEARRPEKGGVKLLEPIMKVEVVTPEDYVGSVIGDLNSPSRPDPGPGHARQRHRHQRDGAARQHVRLRQPAAVHEPGPRHVHHAVRPLRAGAANVAAEVQAKYA
jgi:elongation factor G